MELHPLYIQALMPQPHDIAMLVPGRDLQFRRKPFFTDHPAMITAYLQLVRQPFEQVVPHLSIAPFPLRP